MAGGLLLCFLLRRTLATRNLAADLHFDDERLVVVWADFVHHGVFGQRKTPSLRKLLKGRLVVLKEEILGVDRGDVLRERLLDQLSRRFDSTVDIDGGDHRLEEIGE